MTATGFQSFEATTRPQDGPPRLAALRAELAAEGLAGFLVPRADLHQGENVAPRDERLAWLTGFTGSAGFAAILTEAAGVFVDGRYTLQVRAQVADCYTPVSWPGTQLGPWLTKQLTAGVVGFDPWLHTKSEIDRLTKAVAGTDITLRPVTENLVDRIWSDQPAAPQGQAMPYPVEFAGTPSGQKRAEIAAVLQGAGQNAAVLTLPDSICWLLNIRGSDIARMPVMLATAIVHGDGRVDLFTDAAKVAGLGPDPAITIHDPVTFAPALAQLTGTVRVDPKTAPIAVFDALENATVVEGDDPCLLPKATKTEAEIAATTEAHLRDGAAMVEFLAWFDRMAPGGTLTEIDVAQALEGFRRATNELRDISFDTIAGSGPNGAIVHYRVTEGTNRQVTPGELFLIDSGGQYIDGTTDITRTIATAPTTGDEVACFTRVLKGMITLSQIRWPKGLAGRDLDALVRAPLWQAGQDYDHGTGHGVGVFLGVHEGPQRLARTGEVPLKPGMILSNEPGYYREGAFGIRIENLVVVEEALNLPSSDPGRVMYRFRTLTLAPIDRRLIDRDMLTQGEVDWLNTYHAEVWDQLHARVSDAARIWLRAATEPL